MSTGGARSRARGTVDIGRPPRGRVELGLRTRVIAPLTSGSRGGLLDEAAVVGDEPVDLVEWRADSMVRALAGSSFAAAPDLVGELTATAGALLGASALPLIATVRTSSEGGAAHLDDSEYCALVASLAVMADAVDVEIGREGAPDLVREAQRAGARVIASHHDFGGTPGDEELAGVLAAMNHAGADVLKIACAPRSGVDVARVLTAGAWAREAYDRPVIAIAMGRLGGPTRFAGAALGGAATFASVGGASAPGQYTAREARTVLDIIEGAPQ